MLVASRNELLERKYHTRRPTKTNTDSVSPRRLCRGSLDRMLAEASIQGSVCPGFWSILGFLVIAGLITEVLLLGLGLLSMLLENTRIQVLLLMILAPIVGVLGGFTALFMYSSYVRLSVVQLLTGG